MTRDRPKRRVVDDGSALRAAIIDAFDTMRIAERQTLQHVPTSRPDERARTYDAMARPYSYRVARASRSHDTRRTAEEMAAQEERDK